jgi:hypothetical protein
VRKTAEPLHDRAVVLRLGQVVTAEAAAELDGALLVRQIFGMTERQVKELLQVRRDGAVVACGDCGIRNPASGRIGRVHPRRAAKRVARELIEQDTLPRMLVRVHGARFGVTAIEPPLPLGASRVRVVATRAATTDAGVAWLMEIIERAARSNGSHAASRRRPTPA